MITRFTREQAIFFVIMSFVCSYGYIEPFFCFDGSDCSFKWLDMVNRCNKIESCK